MIERPETRYAAADGARIAYQVYGSGPRTLIGIPGFAQHVELIWDQPHAARFFDRLGSLCRVIHFDKRGTGLSDRALPPASLDARVEDLVAVMSAEGVERAVVAGFSEGGTMAAFFAASYPERSEGLILAGSYATWTRADDHPWAPSRRRQLLTTRAGAALWGTGLVTVKHLAPSMAKEPGFRSWAARYERKAIARSQIVPWARLAAEMDIRSVLPTIYAPTLVLHATGDRLVPVQSGRYLADHIDGADFVALPTDDHGIWFEAQDAYLDAMERFLSGTRAATDQHRRFATVLFTDIVDSTAHAARVGDSRWITLLDQHDHLSRIELGIHGGRWVKSTGDGILATFESPSRAVRCAFRLRERLQAELGVAIRAGLHAGEIEQRGDDVAGIGLHMAARVQACADRSAVLVSAAVRDLIAGEGVTLSSEGTYALKGIPGECEIYSVTAAP